MVHATLGRPSGVWLWSCNIGDLMEVFCRYVRIVGCRDGWVRHHISSPQLAMCFSSTSRSRNPPRAPTCALVKESINRFTSSMSDTPSDNGFKHSLEATCNRSWRVCRTTHPHIHLHAQPRNAPPANAHCIREQITADPPTDPAMHCSALDSTTPWSRRLCGNMRRRWGDKTPTTQARQTRRRPDKTRAKGPPCGLLQALVAHGKT